jgi:hypothetical protein
MKRYAVKLVLVLAVIGWGGATATAQDGLAMMKIESGARPSGMGGAFVAVPSDVSSAAYNPAGAVDVKGFTATFGHTAYWDNVRLESGSFATRLGGRVFAHGGIRFAVIGDLEGRQGPTSDFEPFDAHDVSFKGGLAYRISPSVAAGAAMGWFVEKIDAWRGSAFNVDFGLLARATGQVDLGASVTNLGSAFSLSKSGFTGSRDISLPTTYRVGAAYHNKGYLGALDGVVIDDRFHVHAGAEVSLHKMLRVRAGYMFNYDSKDLTAGASFIRRNLTVDYAFVPYSNDLGSSHLFNLTFSL